MSEIPGGFKLLETVYYVGDTCTLDNGKVVPRGISGTVQGKDNGNVVVEFPKPLGKLTAPVGELSKEFPRFQVGEVVYLVGASRTTGGFLPEPVVYGSRGTVVQDSPYNFRDPFSTEGMDVAKREVLVCFSNDGNNGPRVRVEEQELSRAPPPCGFEACKERDSLQSEMYTIKSQKNSLEKEKHELRRKVELLEKRQEEREDEMRTLTTKKMTLEKQQAQLTTQHQELRARYVALEQTQGKLNRELEDLKKTHHALEGRSADMANRVETTEEQNSILAKTNQQLASSLQEAQQKLDQLTEDHAELQALYRGLAARHETHKRWSEERDEQMSNMEMEVTQMRGTEIDLKKVGLLDHLRKAQAEEEHQRCSPLQFYDVVIDVQRLPDVYRTGWPIYYEDQSKFDLFQTGIDCLSVSITGDFNVGKSWILSRLAKQTFLSGDRVHTQGISVKLVNISEAAEHGLKAFFIDTQGLNSPVMPRAEGSEGGDQQPPSLKLEQSLQEMKALEEFQRQVVLSVSDIFLFVVGQLSAKNQLDLHLLFNAIKDLRRRRRSGDDQDQRVFIVHNLRDWTHEQFEAERYVERIQQIYSPALTLAEWRGCKYLQGRDDSRSVSIKFEHFFLTRDGSAGCQNDQAFQYIRNVIEVSQFSKVSLGTRLGHQMHRWLPSFLQLADRASHPKLELRVQEATETQCAASELCTLGKSLGLFVPAEPPASGITATVRTRSLGSMVSLASDDLCYNMCEIPCTALFGREFEDAMMRVLTIEVPGLDFENFSCLVWPRSADADVPAPTTANVALLKKNSQGNQDGIIAELQLTAKVDCLPKAMKEGKVEGDAVPSNEVFGRKNRQMQTMGLFKKFAQSSRESIKGMEPYVCQVVDKGTRALDPGSSSREVSFKIELSKEDLGEWETSKEFYTAYSDGILAIAFLQEQDQELSEAVMKKFRQEKREPEEECS